MTNSIYNKLQSDKNVAKLNVVKKVADLAVLAVGTVAAAHATYNASEKLLDKVAPSMNPLLKKAIRNSATLAVEYAMIGVSMNDRCDDLDESIKDYRKAKDAIADHVCKTFDSHMNPPEPEPVEETHVDEDKTEVADHVCKTFDSHMNPPEPEPVEETHVDEDKTEVSTTLESVYDKIESMREDKKNLEELYNILCNIDSQMKKAEQLKEDVEQDMEQISESGTPSINDLLQDIIDFKDVTTMSIDDL